MITSSFKAFALFALLVGACAAAPGQTNPQASPTPTRANVLRGEYSRFRANNDLLFYHLDVRVDPDKKFLKGFTEIQFKMLKDDNRIQLDLHEALNVDTIEWVRES